MYELLKYKSFIEGTTQNSVVIKSNSIQPFPIKSLNDWGLIEWNAFQLGNGDVCGFYWKIGAEEENPIICAMHHDDWELLPWSSDLSRFFKLIAGVSKPPFNNDFWFDLEDLKNELDDYHIVFDFKNILKVATLEDAIKVDNLSPLCLKYMGDQHRQKENIDLAEKSYLKSLSILPEYGEASFSLAMLYRSQCQNNLAIHYFIDAFTSPFYFFKQQEKILGILKRYKDDSFYNIQDPIWKRRNFLKLDTGEKYPTFYKVLNEVIEEYIHLNEFRRAIGLRIFLGMFACNNEQISYQYQLREHQNLLRQNLEAANMKKRLALHGL